MKTWYILAGGADTKKPRYWLELQKTIHAGEKVTRIPEGEFVEFTI